MTYPSSENHNKSNSFGPSVSVCMAAYNGELYIKAQLESILSQLREEDEVVVVDDASTDDTKARVSSLSDDRIRLIEHASNLGVSRTFEEAIRNARNDIIFLSDQDDLWLPDKVPTILAEFQNDPRITLVAGDSALIDQDGKPLADSYFAGRGEFKPGLLANLIRNQYGGCTLAFRASVRSEFLPLPHKCDVLHDIWIGVRNYLSGGQAVFIERPLILNRRHPGTATGKKRLTLSRRIRTRVYLLFALAAFSLRKRLKRAEYVSGVEREH